MSKKPPKPIAPFKKSLARSRAKIEPLTTFYIYSEGKVTEPDYINNFYREKCKKRYVILAPISKAAGVPLTIVEACVAKKAALLQAGRRDSYEKNFVLWAVFDIDEHPKMDEAIKLESANGIRCIISNPCIEVWGLMHFTQYEKPSTCSVSCDHVPRRSWPLFRARAVLGELIASLPGRQSSYHIEQSEQSRA